MKEKYYLVTVTETLSRTVKVKAESLDDANQIVSEAYDDINIVLDADDFDELDITSREVTNEDLDLYEEVI